MKVKAIEMGFYRGARVRPGTVFELVGNDKPGKWMADPETGQPIVPGILIRDKRRVMKTKIRDSKPADTFSAMTKASAGQ